MKSILYIGNKMAGSKDRTLTTLDTLSQQLRDEGFTVYSASSKRNKVLRLLEMLWFVLKFSRRVHLVLIDTYSTQNFYYAAAVANLCRVLGLPYAPILHGGNLPERLKRSKNLSYKLFNGSKTNIAPSRYLLEAFAAQGYHNVTHIPNTIDISQYSFLAREKVKPKLLWVRSFAKIYNPMLAVKVVERLTSTYPDITLCMIGPDKDGSLEECKAYALQNNLPVTFTGKLSKSEWRTKAALFDIFISTTNFDNTPVSVIEAMALGLAVISTNVGGVPYLIDDKKTGVLVPPQDLDSYVAAVILLLEDTTFTAQLSNRARRQVESYDWQIVKQDWLTLLDH